jgi:hypothetical protein
MMVVLDGKWRSDRKWICPNCSDLAGLAVIDGCGQLWQRTCSAASGPRFYLPPQVTRFKPDHFVLAHGHAQDRVNTDLLAFERRNSDESAVSLAPATVRGLR